MLHPAFVATAAARGDDGLHLTLALPTPLLSLTPVCPPPRRQVRVALLLLRHRQRRQRAAHAGDHPPIRGAARQVLRLGTDMRRRRRLQQVPRAGSFNSWLLSLGHHRLTKWDAWATMLFVVLLQSIPVLESIPSYMPSPPSADNVDDLDDSNTC